MKRFIMLIGFFLIFPLPTRAACSEISVDASCPAGKIKRDYTLDIAGTPGCTSGTDGPHTVCCDELSEANAVDSVRAPLCGSSQELGKANSSCWTCGADIRCAGLDLGLESADTTADIINNKQAISQTDTPQQVEQTWRVPNDKIPDTFRFNGIEYNRDGKGLIICRSNVLGCGASEVACESTLYGKYIPDESTDDPNAGKPQVEGIPIRRPNVPITDINTVPGHTAINITSRREFTVSGLVESFFKRVTTALQFVSGPDGRPKTSESEFDTEMEMFLGVFEPEWNAQGRLQGVDQGGKLMPLMLANTSLSWPVEKEGSLMTEKYVQSSGSYFGEPKDFECNVSPLMAETEPLKYDLPITLSGNVILGAITGTQRTDGNPGVPNLNLGTPRQEWGYYNDTNDRIELKPQLTELFKDCKANSSVRENKFHLFNILGFLGFGSGDADASRGLSTGYDVSGGPNDVIRDDCSGVQCILRYFIPMTTSTTVWIGSDGHPANYSSVIGGKNLQNNVGNADANVADLAENYRGWVNTSIPLTLQEDWKLHNYDTYGHAFTNLPQRPQYFVLGDREREVNYVTHAGAAATKDGIVAGLCMYSPLSKQNELFGMEKCEKVLEKSNATTTPNVPNTSTWAISQTISSQPFTPSGDFSKLLKQFSEDSGVPQCVLEGVADIEGGDRYDELPLNQCLATVNRCSAVGPMQFTTGQGPASDPTCSTCDAGYCPNAWARYGNNGNPCSYTDSLSAASRYLADYGHFDGNDLKKSVHDATTAFYDSDNDATARQVLGGCEYWEYVYRQCEPTYVCQANR